MFCVRACDRTAALTPLKWCHSAFYQRVEYFTTFTLLWGYEISFLANSWYLRSWINKDFKSSFEASFPLIYVRTYIRFFTFKTSFWCIYIYWNVYTNCNIHFLIYISLKKEYVVISVPFETQKTQISQKTQKISFLPQISQKSENFSLPLKPKPHHLPPHNSQKSQKIRNFPTPFSFVPPAHERKQKKPAHLVRAS